MKPISPAELWNQPRDLMELCYVRSCLTTGGFQKSWDTTLPLQVIYKEGLYVYFKFSVIIFVFTVFRHQNVNVSCSIFWFKCLGVNTGFMLTITIGVPKMCLRINWMQYHLIMFFLSQRVNVEFGSVIIISKE